MPARLLSVWLAAADTSRRGGWRRLGLADGMVTQQAELGASAMDGTRRVSQGRLLVRLPWTARGASAVGGARGVCRGRLRASLLGGARRLA